MDSQFIARYAEKGRLLNFMGFVVETMNSDQLHAVIGFLLERAGDETELDLAQFAPLGAPRSDPPKNDSLFEG
jgi:hypothetical protein